MKICFTGHRPKDLGFEVAISGYSGQRLRNTYRPESYQDFIRDLAAMLAGYYSIGYTEFITGGAQGMDQLAFLAVDLMKSSGLTASNILYMPFEGQGDRWSASGYFGKRMLCDIRNRADKVRTICPGELTDRQKIAALMRRNHAMVNDSDLVLALFRHDNINCSGGTAECIRYAVSQNKPVIILNTEIRRRNSDEFLTLTGARGLN